MAAWGNALGGYKRQRRDSRGRFSSGSLVGAGLHRRARRRKGGFVPYGRKGLGHTTIGVNTGLSISKNRRISGGFYLRTENMKSQKKAKQIAKGQEHLQLAVASRLPRGGERTLGGNLMRVKRAQSKAMRATIGKERKVGNYAYARTGTDRNALPTVIVRYNGPKDKRGRSAQRRNSSITTYNVKSVTGKRTFDWNQKPVNSRPQRRKKNGKR
ncbi:hypothetical protein SEA_LITTLEFELLA_8 [Gordonia phage LittleFella]|nr:hypothetical protein SEA_LITTLEFELLA_8 [Gordonia phage LittleFella]